MIAENGTRQRANLADNVVLDYSGLFSQEKQAPKSPVDAVSQDNAGNLSSQKEKPATGRIEGLEREQARSLTLQAKKGKEDREEALRICREYQANTAKSQLYQSDILKGIKAGENIYSLFLKAAKIISFMTNNSLFYTQAEKDIIAIHGAGLQEQEALTIELGKVQERLQKLTEAEGREEDPDSRERIQRAITAHRARAGELERMIEKA